MFSVALKIILYDKVRSLITLAGVVFAVALIFAQIGEFTKNSSGVSSVDH